MNFKNLFVALLLAWAFPSFSYSQDCSGSNAPAKPIKYIQMTVSSSAVPLTDPQGRMAVIVVESNPIRYRDDGTAPTASVGTPVDAKFTIVVCGRAMSLFQAIAQGADSKLNVHFYGN